MSKPDSSKTLDAILANWERLLAGAEARIRDEAVASPGEDDGRPEVRGARVPPGSLCHR